MDSFLVTISTDVGMYDDVITAKSERDAVKKLLVRLIYDGEIDIDALITWKAQIV